MPMINNPTPNQEGSQQRKNMIPTAIALVIAIAIGLTAYSYFFSGDIATTQPINRSEDNSLTAPTSDYPYDKKERQDANDKNLSSRPSQDTDTNNKPFEDDNKNKSSSTTNPN